MRIKSQLFLNNILVGMIPAVLVFLAISIVTGVQSSSITQKSLEDRLESVKKKTGKDIEVMMNYAGFFANNVSRFSQLAAASFSFVNWGFTHYAIKNFDVTISNEVIYRNAYQAEYYAYSTSAGNAQELWSSLDSPFYPLHYAMYFYEIVSNIVVVRCMALAVDDRLAEKIGIFIISVPYTVDYLREINEDDPDWLLYIRTSNGVVFSKEELNNDPAGGGALSRVSDDEERHGTLTLADNQSYYVLQTACFAKKGQTLASMGVLYSFSTASRSILVIQWAFLALLLICLVAAFTITLVFSRSITRPLTLLNRLSEDYQIGGEVIPRPERDKNEFDVLQNSLHVLSAKILDYKKIIDEKSAELESERNDLRNSLDIQVHLNDSLLATSNDLDNANLKLKELDRLKTETLHMVTHELRTPLTSIMGFARIIQIQMEKGLTLRETGRGKGKRYNSPEIGEEVVVIVRECERLIRLVNNYLDLSKLEAGKTEFHFEDVCVRDAVMESLQAVETLFSQRGLKSVIEIADGIQPVWADREKLREVIINLLSNALKFTMRGSVTVRASAENGFATVSVIDTGMGIAPGDIGHIFDKFQQKGREVTGVQKGSGLGLSICKQIVERMGGGIRCESEEGKGSVFSFTIPFAGTQAAAR